MSRIRTIKPSFFRHEGLFEAERDFGLPLRVAFAGLWTVADREGRFQWRPRALKLDCLPYDEVDFSRVLDALATRGFIVKYASQGEYFGLIPTFPQHQIVNNRESASTLPEPENTININELTRPPRVNHASTTRHDLDQGEQEQEQEQEGKGTIPNQDSQTEPIDRKSKKPKAKIDSVDFDTRFWPAYPHKVGKRAAETAFERARCRAELDQILAGLDRYARDKPPDRPWCNPATWLNQDRWLDQPAPAQIMANGHRGPISAFSRPTVGDEIAAFEQSAARHEANAKRLRAEIEADKQKTLELGNGKLGEHSR